MGNRRLAFLVLFPGTTLALALVVLALFNGMGSSMAQQGLMHNCPEPGMWAVSVWAGDDGTDIGQALDTCGEGTVAAAYYIDPLTQDWLRWFPGRPEVSDLLELDSLQGIVAQGAASAPTPTVTATLTPSTSVTPLATETPTVSPTEAAASMAWPSATPAPSATATPYSDRDTDGVDNMSDNCPFHPNPGQEDTYCTDLGDACDCSYHDGICWYAGGTVLVGFEFGTNQERAEEIVSSTGATIENCYEDPTWCSAGVPHDQELQYIQSFAGFEEVRYAGLNHVLEIDPW
jgi:hypothetical protein